MLKIGKAVPRTGSERPAANAILGALTPFEHLMLADDRPEHPMTFFLRARGLGTLDESRLRRAARAALARHPLLNARPLGSADDKGGDVVWTAGDGEPLIDFAPLGVPFARDGRVRRLDLAQHGGLNVVARSGGGRFELTLELHHAAADATGGLQFLEDLLHAYGDRHAAMPAAAPRLDPEKLRRRGEFHLDAAARRRQLASDLKRISLYFSQFPEPVPPRAGERRSSKVVPPTAGPSTVTVALADDEVGALRRAARRAGGTVNDVLLRDAFLALDRYAILQGKRLKLRLAMPINMRRAGDAAMPAANVVSMCFLDRAGEALDDAERLLAGIVRETRDIKRCNSGLALIRVASTCARAKGGLRFLMTPRAPMKCSSTAVLSNLGRPLDGAKLARDAAGRIVVGELTFEAIELLPPLRPETRLAIGATLYGRQLFMTLHYDARQLSNAAVAQIASELRRALTATAARAERPRALASLIEESREKRRSPPFRALPIGKNVNYGLSTPALKALESAPFV